MQSFDRPPLEGRTKIALIDQPSGANWRANSLPICTVHRLVASLQSETLSLCRPLTVRSLETHFFLAAKNGIDIQPEIRVSKPLSFLLAEQVGKSLRIGAL